MAENEDIKAMTFEQALAALEQIVDDLERGDVPLDQSIRTAFGHSAYSTTQSSNTMIFGPSTGHSA